MLLPANTKHADLLDYSCAILQHVPPPRTQLQTTLHTSAHPHHNDFPHHNCTTNTSHILRLRPATPITTTTATTTAFATTNHNPIHGLRSVTNCGSHLNNHVQSVTERMLSN